MWITAQAVPSSSAPNPWAQLGIAGIVCATWFLIAYLLWQDNKAGKKEIARLQQCRIDDRDAWATRENDRAERVIPLLSQAADALKLAPERFDRVLDKASSAMSSTKIDMLVARMEEALEEAARAQRRSAPGGSGT